jgi:hypothetical protein
LGTRIVMAGLGTAVRYWRARGRIPARRKWRAKPVSGPLLRLREENVLPGRMNAVRTLNAVGPFPRERIYCGARGGWKKSDDERWPSAAVAEKKRYSSP